MSVQYAELGTEVEVGKLDGLPEAHPGDGRALPVLRPRQAAAPLVIDAFSHRAGRELRPRRLPDRRGGARLTDARSSSCASATSRSSRASTRRGSSPTRSTGCPGRDPRGPDAPDLQRLAGRRVIAAQVLSRAHRPPGRAARRLPGHADPPGQRASGSRPERRRSASTRTRSYADYLVPAEMLTCWISLHETTRRRRPDRVRPRLAPVAEVAARALAVPCARGLARARAERRARGQPSSRSCRSSSSRAAARSITA